MLLWVVTPGPAWGCEDLSPLLQSCDYAVARTHSRPACVAKSARGLAAEAQQGPAPDFGMPAWSVSRHAGTHSGHHWGAQVEVKVVNGPWISWIYTRKPNHGEDSIVASAVTAGDARPRTSLEFRRNGPMSFLQAYNAWLRGVLF